MYYASEALVAVRDRKTIRRLRKLRDEAHKNPLAVSWGRWSNIELHLLGIRVDLEIAIKRLKEGKQ